MYKAYVFHSILSNLQNSQFNTSTIILMSIHKEWAYFIILLDHLLFWFLNVKKIRIFWKTVISPLIISHSPLIQSILLCSYNMFFTRINIYTPITRNDPYPSSYSFIIIFNSQYFGISSSLLLSLDLYSLIILLYIKSINLKIAL